jgi:hypothetical protein
MFNENLNCEELIINLEQIDKKFTIEKIIKYRSFYSFYLMRGVL